MSAIAMPSRRPHSNARRGRHWLPAVALTGLAGCTTPQFMVSERHGAPTVLDIVARIRCELADLVRADSGFGDHRKRLIAGNYQVAVAISLLVTETGELAPSFNFPIPPQFSFNVGARLARTRDQNYLQNLYFSMVDIENLVNTAPDAVRCPGDNGNLSGDLGIRQTAMMALQAPGGYTAPLISGISGEFGGYASFVLVRNVNAVGPNWTLTHFRGPGNMGTLGRTDTNRVTFAFAAKAATTPRVRSAEVAPSARAREILNQLLLNQLTLPSAR
ncbi:hypothetical protein ACJ4V0_03025 [Phreatobacter sp. HK31-P]